MHARHRKLGSTCPSLPPQLARRLVSFLQITGQHRSCPTLSVSSCVLPTANYTRVYHTMEFETLYSPASGLTDHIPPVREIEWVGPWQKQKEKRALQERLAKQAAPSPYTPFFVPDSILSTMHHNPHPQSALLNLPTEIFLTIVEHVSIPHFQVCLALTCKTLASTISTNRTRLSPWRGYRDKEGLFRLLARLPKYNPPNPWLSGFPKRLPQDTQPSDLLDAQNVPWYIPPHLRLCRACWIFVPRTQSYWSHAMSSAEYDRPNVNWFDIMNFFNESDRDCGQHKCPRCCVRGFRCFMSEDAYRRALRQDEYEEWELGFELGDLGRRVCPGLLGRLGRP